MLLVGSMACCFYAIQERDSMQEEEEEAPRIQLDECRVGDMDLDMLFKLINLSDLPQPGASDDLVYVHMQGPAPKVYHERGNFIHLCSHPIDTFCGIPHGCRSLSRVKMMICQALVECGLQLAIPCLDPGCESLMLGLAKIPAKIFLAALPGRITTALEARNSYKHTYTYIIHMYIHTCIHTTHTCNTCRRLRSYIKTATGRTRSRREPEPQGRPRNCSWMPWCDISREQERRVCLLLLLAFGIEAQDAVSQG